MAMFDKALLIASLAFPVAGSAQTLRDAAAAAYARNPQLLAAEARGDEVRARRVQADAWLAGPPALSLGQRTDRPLANAGKREFEVEVAAPLWLPGQRGAQQELVAAEAAENELEVVALRLQVAGELRDAIWALRAADAERELAFGRSDSARQLEQEVARRVSAGDLARSDLLLAQGERLAAEAAELEAGNRVAQAMQRYSLLTGFATLPADAEEPRRDAAPTEAAAPDHPRIEAGRRALARAQSNLQAVQGASRDAPELTVQYQRGRDDFDSPTRDNVRVGIRIPFGTEARNRPLVAAANTEIVKAHAELSAAEAAVAAELRDARTGLANAERAAALADQRRAAAAENLRLTRKGFDLGELPLAQLLRAQAQAQEAEAARTLQKTAVALAVARLNQAQGLLP
ncbi:TolC family protein [Azoarcus sp. KH32C]|uniref:TolC family protein n=1 Tax=Azoarcus sp. KH32C TaxID=748247 RepID=UPI000344FEF0|nr:TolC family protein [Azoarcus sp. KH32C]